MFSSQLIIVSSRDSDVKKSPSHAGAERIGGGGSVCFSGLFWSWSEAAVDSSCWEFGSSALWNIQAGGSAGASSAL